jgi:hypothetical protein
MPGELVFWCVLCGKMGKSMAKVKMDGISPGDYEQSTDYAR